MIDVRVLARAGLALSLAFGFATRLTAQDKPAAAEDKPAAPAAEAAKPGEAAKKTNTIAVFRLSGDVQEKPGEDLALFGASSSGSLHDLVTRLKKAAADEQVKAVVVLLDAPSVGMAQIEELRQAMGRVRDAGKPVYAHADELSTGSFALLSGADRLSVVPTADVWVTGLYGEAPYVRGLLDKLGVKPDFLTCGAYKSAAEMFMRSGPSPEAEKMQNWLLDSQVRTVLELIASGRKVSPETVQTWFDGGPYSAEKAKALGILDAVEHRQDFEAMLREKYGADVAFDKKYGRKAEPKPDFSSPFGIFKFYGELLGAGTKPAAAKKPAVGIVYVDGAIALGSQADMGLFGSEGAFSTALRRALDEAAGDDSIKAVVLRVDSPGGSAVASEIILDATRRVKARKPFVVSMGNVAGSGGYYVACASDTIFADRSTITASIGVVAGKMATEDLFNKVGVTFHAYQRGKFAGLLASGDTFSEEERAKLQAWMDEIYGVFKGHVTASRGDRLKKPIDELAGGRVFTGQQALELGLVDRIGTLDDAIAHVAEKASLGKDYEVRAVPRAKNFLEILLEDADDATDDRKGLDVATRPAGLKLGVSAPILEMAAPFLSALDPARAQLVRSTLQRLELLQREGVLLVTPELGLNP